MNKGWITLLILVCAAPVLAQDYTYKNHSTVIRQQEEKVLIIPFEDRMFISDINKEVANRTGLTLTEIKSTFRSGLVQTIAEMGADYGDYIDPFELEQQDMENILGAVYSRLNYDYVEVVPLDEVTEKGLLERLEVKNEKSQVGRGTFVDEGQLKSWYDDKERFMQARLKPEVVQTLMLTYQVDFLLVLTELDIQVMRDVSRDVGQVWPRRVKVHFSIYDKTGEQTMGSAAYNYYDGDQKDIYGIIRNSFDFPAAQIITTIENSANPENSKKKKPEDQKDKDSSELSRKERIKSKLPKLKQESSDEDF